MLELKTLDPKTDRRIFSTPRLLGSQEPKQQRMMVIALSLLLIALGFVLYRDRDFWFPDDQQIAEDQPLQTVPATINPAPSQQISEPAAPASASVANKQQHSSQKSRKAKSQPALAASAEQGDSADSSAAPMTATTQRTVLPPLEVEVVAGDSHRTIRPGTNSVRVDLEPGEAPQAVPSASSSGSSNSGASQTTAAVTSNAVERVQMSADTSEVVSHSVKPGYPMLARQMKVQGSVILQALIGRDGLIQDLRVLSGPPILASAAQEAVKQWHFKPHYLGADAVETQAKITVNFTISTN